MNNFEAGQACTVVLNKYSISLQQEQNFKNEPSMEDKVLQTNEVEYNLLTWSGWDKSFPHAASLGVLEMIQHLSDWCNGITQCDSVKGHLSLECQMQLKEIGISKPFKIKNSPLITGKSIPWDT